MPDRKLRKSPSRAAAAAAAKANSVSPRQKSPSRRSGKSPARKTEKSPSRKVEKSPSRKVEKSPSRKVEKSPSRKAEKSPSRKFEKSPARRTEKSPARKYDKSPSRTNQKSSPKKSPIEKKSPARTSTDILILHKEEIIKQPRVLLLNHDRGDTVETSSSRGRSREPSTSSSSLLVRRSTRITSSKEYATEFEGKKGIEQLKTSVEDEELEYPEKPISQKETSQVREFGGAIGILFMLTFQPLLLLAHLYCSKAQYGIKDFKIPFDWKAYFDLEVAALYIGFVVLQLLLSIFPIGKLVDGQPNKLGRLKYRCNGLLSTILTVAGFAALKYFKFPVTIIVDKYIQFLVTSFIFGYVLSLILYIRGGRAHILAQNPYAVTGNHIYDFWMGREINPRIGPFDIKIGLQRVAVIGMILVNLALVLRGIEKTGTYSPTLLVAAGLQIWYALDFLWFEESFLITFEIMYEGVGYMMCVGYSLYPFFATITTRFILNYRVEIPLYAIVAIILISTIGYVIFRASNSQKSDFRKNPLNPALAHLETIPTTRGKKLLVSGWWGWVRHPNYLGDIIMHWSWTFTCGLVHPLPYVLFPLFITWLLLNRAKRDDARCRQRYNAAWERYCNRVKYLVIPKVF